MTQNSSEHKQQTIISYARRRGGHAAAHAAGKVGHRVGVKLQIQQED